MTRKQFKQHLLDNRNDLEALRELQSRPNPNSVTISADTSKEEAKRILREAINRARLKL